MDISVALGLAPIARRPLPAALRSCCALYVPERDLHPLPIDVVRDLLGIARAAYAVHLRKGNRGIAARLKRAGEDLRRALALAVKDGGPVANERAWYLASSAAQVIARETCMGRETLGHAVEVTAQRMRSRAQQSVIDSRTARRERRIKRG